MDYKKAFEKFADENTFIKVSRPTEKDRAAIEGSQKAALNRKGNVLLNSGDVEAARRIFLTTGYSDGISRVGDAYRAQGRTLEALKMYWLAPDRTKAASLMEQLSRVIRDLMNEEEDDE